MIRFPNDNLVNKLMRRQDNFWRRLDKKRSEKKEADSQKAKNK